MEFYEAFVDYLNRYAGLTALIGDSIFPDYIPQDEDAPAVVYQLISETPDYTLQGEIDVKQPIYQFSCFAYTAAAAYAIYKQLRKAFKDYQGTMSTYYVQHIKVEQVLGKDYDSTTGRHSYKVDFELSYTEGA